MATFIQSILSEFSAQGSIDKGVMVANGNTQAPAMAYHLHVPRIELTVKGTLRMLLPKGVDRIVKYERPVGTITYIPANSWNSPLWESPVICMSIVFWKQDVGFSISNWDGTQFKEVEKYNLQNSSSTVRDRLLDLAESLAWSQDTTSETFAHLVYALLNDLLYQITDGLNNQRAPSHCWTKLRAISIVTTTRTLAGKASPKRLIFPQAICRVCFRRSQT